MFLHPYKEDYQKIEAFLRCSNGLFTYILKEDILYD